LLQWGSVSGLPFIQDETGVQKMNFEFSGDIWFWRRPAPFYFVTVPREQSSELKAISGLVTYGWGMIPVTARIGKTKFFIS